MVVARADREGSCNAVHACGDRCSAWHSRVLAASTDHAVRGIIVALRRQVLARNAVEASVYRGGTFHRRVLAHAACCTCVDRSSAHGGRKGPRDTCCTMVNTSGPGRIVIVFASIARDAVHVLIVALLRREFARCALLTGFHRCSTHDFGVLAACTGNAVRRAVAALQVQILACGAVGADGRSIGC